MKKTLLLSLCLFLTFVSSFATKAIIDISATQNAETALSSFTTSIDTLIVTSTVDVTLTDLNAIRNKFKGKSASSFTIDLSGAKFADRAIPSGHSNGAGAFDLGSSYFSCLKEIILPSDLKTIGARAFRYCNNLRYINFPDGLETIGDLAFAQNASKMNAFFSPTELPNSITTIGQYAFQANSSLSLIKLPETLEGIINTRTFSHTSIAISDIPEGVTTIKGGAFNPESEGRAKITSISFPSTLVTLEASSFSKQTKLAAITFKTTTPPFGITEDPFASLTNKTLVTLFIPKGAKATYETYKNAFDGMNIVEIDDDEEPAVVGELQISLNTTGTMETELSSALGTTPIGDISVLTIKGSAYLNFDDCRAIANKFQDPGLTTLNLTYAKFLNDSIPASKTSGTGAFYGMKIENIKLPNSLREIGDRAFQNCKILSDINSPAMLKAIRFAAFAGCSNLNISELTPAMETIDGYAFQDCNNLQLTNLPTGLRGTIGDFAFAKTKITIDEIPYGVTSIGANTFNSVTTITEISFPSTLNSIGNKAFEKATGITSISIKKDGPPSVESTTFNTLTLDGITLHVPEGSKDNFNFSPWNEMNPILDDAEEEIIVENPHVINTSFDGRQRKYLFYRPKNNLTGPYDGILVTCHGMGGKMENALPMYGFQAAADALNMMVISPQAHAEENPVIIQKANQYSLQSMLGANWGQVIYAEIGSILNLQETLNKDIDDVAFLRDLIQKNAKKYNANTKNTFIGGISMGGFLAYGYAVKHHDELAGIINITGSMGLKLDTLSVLSSSLPILDFHSLTDGTVFYEGKGTYKVSILSVPMENSIPKTEVLDFWARKNGITTAPTVEDLGKDSNNSAVSIKKIHYQENGKKEILHYQLDGAEHSHYLTGLPITHAKEVRDFIQRHMDTQSGTTITNDSKLDLDISILDNMILIDGVESSTHGMICNTMGKLTKSFDFNPQITNAVSIEDLTSGIYILFFENQSFKFIKR